MECVKAKHNVLQHSSFTVELNLLDVMYIRSFS